MSTNIYKRNIVYRVRTINKKSILFGDNQCFELNEVASMIWANLDGENAINDLVSMIAEEYKVDINIVKEDVNKFITEMVKNKVILECN
ncbi:PqqD family protein [Clostridiaceae bacterium M8S5]|nr:PqqD family protein [Clostridiaceae bacterium M8S5]